MMNPAHDTSDSTAAATPGPNSPKSLTPRLSVITVTWNGLEMVRRHLEALDRCRTELRDPLEVIVVDNASSDGTPEMIEREFPWVALIRNSENLGFAKGCGQGLERARAEFLLLLNPDCEAEPGALIAMSDFRHRFPGTGAVGCRLVYADGSIQRSAYGEHTPWRYVVYTSAVSPLLDRLRRMGERLSGALMPGGESRWSRRPPRRCDWLMGACLMTTREVYEGVGPPDPAFFMYSEDAEWCRRIRATGKQIYYLPAPAVLHRQKQSSARTREFTYVRLYRSFLMDCLRHKGENELRAMRRVVLADMALRRCIFAVLSILPGERGKANRERLRATRRAAAIWRRMDPAFDPDRPPESPRNT